MISGAHPAIFSFIEKLRLEQRKNEFLIEGYLAGNPPPFKKSVYQQVALRIKKAAQDYLVAPSVLMYLRGTAHNLQLQAHS